MVCLKLVRGAAGVAGVVLCAAGAGAQTVVYDNITGNPTQAALYVPALILQPLIENAIRHGVELGDRGRVALRASSDEPWLTLRVDVQCLGEHSDQPGNGLGIGLDVTRRRLACLYGADGFALDLTSGSDNSSVTLRIPREAQLQTETVHV